MWLTKVQTAAAVVLSVALLGGGAFTYRSLAAGPGDEQGQVGRTGQPAGQGKAKDKPDDRAADELKKLKAENERLRAMLEDAKARERDMAVKHEADVALLNRRLKELEEKVSWSEKNGGRVPAADTVRGQPRRGNGSGEQPGARPRPADSDKMPPDILPAATLEAAKDAVEVLQAQVQVKKAELQGAMIDLRAAERSLTRIRALGKAAAVSSEEVNEAEDKVGRAQAAVQIKEAELHEQEIRLQQAKRRLDQLQPGKGTPSPTADSQQLQDVRKELERLMRKVESLEKGSKPPAQDSPRRP